VLTLASLISEFWLDEVLGENRDGIFLVLVGFIVSFVACRATTRLQRSPNAPSWLRSAVTGSGVHIHHLVWGICLMIAAGAIGFASAGENPWFDIAAALFGIGVGLTIDEFALWFYLEDVYWAEQGRKSIDATVIAAAGMLLLLFGFEPFEFSTASFSAVTSALLSAVVVFAFVAACFAKGRILHGWIGFFVLPVAIYGASRIGKPDSPWARRFYGDRKPAKQVKSSERFAPGRRTERFKQRFRDVVGGATEAEYEAKLAAEKASRDEAAEKLRERAQRVP
jgi:lysyl-tRNA synthetase class 2